MTNAEIDLRLKCVTDFYEEECAEIDQGGLSAEKIVPIELGIMNMNLTALVAMLGEIAKRLPDPQPEPTVPKWALKP